MSRLIDYDNLLAVIADWLAREDLTTQIKDFVWLAECDIQRTIRFRDPQDKTVTGTTISGQEWITLPNDYQEGGHLRWTSDDGLPTMEVASIDVVDYRQRNPGRQLTDNSLRVGFLWGDRIYIGPTPGTVDYELFYHSGVQHLSYDQPTNLILEQYPDVLMYGALVTSAPYLGADERIQTWNEFYQNAKEETRQSEWRARTSHAALRMRPDVQVL